MAGLQLVIDESRKKVFEIVNSTIKEHPCDVQVILGHISENGQHIKITGTKKDLSVLKDAFKEKGQIATLF